MANILHSRREMCFKKFAAQAGFLTASHRRASPQAVPARPPPGLPEQCHPKHGLWDRPYARLNVLLLPSQNSAFFTRNRAFHSALAPQAVQPVGSHFLFVLFLEFSNWSIPLGLDFNFVTDNCFHELFTPPRDLAWLAQILKT